MDSDPEQPDKKKRRVTKACDQCRKRRIKCASYPNAAIDAPCVICTEANQAEACTYSRPTRKRGPQAGKAKSLQEKCEAFERLVGHLLLTVPSIVPHLDAFFRSASVESPDSASPASTSSAPTTSAEQQQQAYRASSVAQQLENVLPVPIPAGKKSTPVLAKAEPTTTSLSSSSSMPAFDSGMKSANDSADSAGRPRSGWSSSNPANLSSPQPTQPPSLSFPAQSSFSPLPQSQPFHDPGNLSTTALQALAHAAVPDHEQAMEGVQNASPTPYYPTAAGKARQRLEVPLLPSESIRNELLDLYFNQVAQPYFPMLDKTLFLRWSAHLPAVPTRTTTSLPSSRLIPPSLYLAVFALASSYLSPSVSHSTHPPGVWAEAARAHLWAELERAPNLETVQAAIIGSIVDWGAGELNRAWISPGLAVALSINLSLHLAPLAQPDPNSLKLKTFHSALIVHALLSLRLARAPLVVLEDYNVPIPPVDGNEDFELWRSDKTPAELKEEYRSLHGSGNGGSDASVPTPPNSTLYSSVSDRTGSQRKGPTGPSAPKAVRSASLTTFARMASLCAIGLAILRWDVCPRRGYGQGLASGERERVELVERLRAWEDELENELRLGDKGAGGGVERLEERARWTVEMHLTLAALYLKLKPHSSFASTAHDPVPPALILLHHILNRYRALYTMYRSLPTIDLALHMLSTTLFLQSDYAPHQHDAPLKAYDESSRLFSVSKTSLEALRAKVDQHKRELGLLRGIHPTASTVPPPISPTPATVALSEPFQAFLSYSADLGPAANPSTVLDFGSWDQTDLLFSLGLVMDPNGAMNAWGLPTTITTTTLGERESGGTAPGASAAALASADGLELPPLIEADFLGLDGRGLGGAGGGPVPLEHAAHGPPAPRDASPSKALHPTTGSPFGASLFHPLAPAAHPTPSHSNAAYHSHPHSSLHPPSYPSASFFFDSTSSSTTHSNPLGGGGIAHVQVQAPASSSASIMNDAFATGDLDLMQDAGGERSTDLLTRWLDRGSVALEGFGGGGGGGEGTGGEGTGDSMT
ncbi:hypothetical protein JCM10212_002698 [Sporobolomyces blumeae]